MASPTNHTSASISECTTTVVSAEADNRAECADLLTTVQKLGSQIAEMNQENENMAACWEMTLKVLTKKFDNGDEKDAEVLQLIAQLQKGTTQLTNLSKAESPKSFEKTMDEFHREIMADKEALRLELDRINGVKSFQPRTGLYKQLLSTDDKLESVAEEKRALKAALEEKDARIRLLATRLQKATTQLTALSVVDSTNNFNKIMKEFQREIMADKEILKMNLDRANGVAGWQVCSGTPMQHSTTDKKTLSEEDSTSNLDKTMDEFQREIIADKEILRMELNGVAGWQVRSRTPQQHMSNYLSDQLEFAAVENWALKAALEEKNAKILQLTSQLQKATSQLTDTSEAESPKSDKKNIDEFWREIMADREALQMNINRVNGVTGWQVRSRTPKQHSTTDKTALSVVDSTNNFDKTMDEFQREIMADREALQMNLNKVNGVAGWQVRSRTPKQHSTTDKKPPMAHRKRRCDEESGLKKKQKQ